MAAPTASRPLRFLDPAVLARLGSLELRARTVVEGFLSGLHRSPYRGFSVEFAEYRQYIPGDDLASLDWKVFARSDRHYVRKYEEDTNVEVHVAIDVSGSMGYRGSAPLSKLDYARTLAASLAYLMTRQRDAVGLLAFGDRLVSRLPPSARSGQLHALLSALDTLTPDGTSDLPRLLTRLAEALTRRGLVILISDLLEDPEPVVRGLRQLRFRGTDVIVFQVLDPSELTFPFRSAARFRDVETGAYVTAQGASVRDGYLEALGTLQDQYARALRSIGADFQILDTSKPLDFALLAYLAARSRRR